MVKVEDQALDLNILLKIIIKNLCVKMWLDSSLSGRPFVAGVAAVGLF
jgi:hypothetical protein